MVERLEEILVRISVVVVVIGDRVAVQKLERDGDPVFVSLELVPAYFLGDDVTERDVGTQRRQLIEATANSFLGAQGRGELPVSRFKIDRHDIVREIHLKCVGPSYQGGPNSTNVSLDEGSWKGLDPGKAAKFRDFARPSAVSARPSYGI